MIILVFHLVMFYLLNLKCPKRSSTTFYSTIAKTMVPSRGLLLLCASTKHGEVLFSAIQSFGSM
jgi:hypothetical protein